METSLKIRWFVLMVIGLWCGSGVSAEDAKAASGGKRPNILWISCEDTSPWLGFCGQPYAKTPHLDRLAREGVHFTSAFTTAPACSPSRFAIITGLYATSMGTQRLRSNFPVPDSVYAFPTDLRRAGYYCCNNVKTDYNTSAESRFIRDGWDESSPRAHWRKRQPGQPFFAVFNLTETHQSKVFERTPAPQLPAAYQHDSATAPLPPYYPDTPEARRTMARVHDCITAMDQAAGKILAQLEEDGLKQNTIVFFWPDHGQGIPRGKRTLFDTGLKIPLVVYCPSNFQHLLPTSPGGTCDRLISMVDLGPTILSILELPIPKDTQGRAFLGKAATAPREYVFGARDRVDEALELSRSVRDPRYLYLRNFMPDLSWNQPEAFSDRLALRRQITQLAASGQLNEAQLTYAGPTKPAEALFDTEKDPWQLKNLAGDPKSRPVLERFRKVLHQWQLETRDLGFLHEWEAARLCAGQQPLSEATASESVYPLKRVLDTAERVGRQGEVLELTRRLTDPNPTVRYWAAIGLRVAGPDAASAKDALRKKLADPVPVQVEAANILVAQWSDGEALDRLAAILRTGNNEAKLHAARTLQLLGEKARPILPAMRESFKSGAPGLDFCLGPAIRALSPSPEETPDSSEQRVSAGLFTDERGELLLEGRPFRGIGVNYYDAFTRTLANPVRTNYDAGFRELAARKIPFARFSAGGYWPQDWDLYKTNRLEHFARLDGVVKSAERYGIGLIPSFFWQSSTVPDLVGEPCNRWGDTKSRTLAFMREYTREVVTRYSRSPAVWGWEFGNEYNLPADLPNAAEHRPPVVPGLGTPVRRTAEDDLTHADIRVAFREFALEVRKHDPRRIIVSGNATPRPSAWHQAKEKSWTPDTRAQFVEMLEADNPSPMNTLSVRGYDLTTDIGRLDQAMAVARAARKPLFVGEFGVPIEADSESKARFGTILSAIETNQVPLSALWVFDFDGQSKDWNVSATNERRWQLDAVQQGNERMRRSKAD